MGINKQEILNKLNESLVEATNKTKLIEINNIFSKNNIAPLYNELKNLSGAEKGEFGKEINELKNEVKKVIDQKMIQIDEEEEKKSHSINYDISLNTSNFKKGALHPISYVFKNLTNFFNKFDFTFEMGNEVEEVKYNFDHLNLAEGHPTRDVSETFYLHDSNITLRTQMTAHSARHLHDNKNEEIRLISPG
jgi:phenylalanyl-tRNA synthetase alpha chain